MGGKHIYYRDNGDMCFRDPRDIDKPYLDTTEAFDEPIRLTKKKKKRGSLIITDNF
jgi:hypothetical protein